MFSKCEFFRNFSVFFEFYEKVCIHLEFWLIIPTYNRGTRLMICYIFGSISLRSIPKNFLTVFRFFKKNLSVFKKLLKKFPWSSWSSGGILTCPYVNISCGFFKIIEMKCVKFSDDQKIRFEPRYFGKWPSYELLIFFLNKHGISA